MLFKSIKFIVKKGKIKIDYEKRLMYTSSFLCRRKTWVRTKNGGSRKGSNVKEV